MANCSNCYGGCTQIVSDKCVQYTGVNVPALDIKKGDSLSWVEQALITFLTATLDGSGITISLTTSDYCELVSQYLQECETVTALDLFKALVKAACDLQGQIDTINETLTELNSDYDVDCLSGVTDSSDTHDVVQAVITKLCQIDTDLTALALDVDTNYVKIADLNTYIAAYIASTATSTRYSSRMVPYSIIPYYGSLSYFDATGAGLPSTEWEDIYLCNGLNGTPDLRGRAIVGAIVAVPGGALSSVVNPASSSFNPNYSLGSTEGANSIVLTTAQIPSHTHTATVVDPGHTHNINLATYDSAVDGPTGSQYEVGSDTPLLTDLEDTGISVSISNTGGGQAHANIQPVLATYFLMYIPA